MSARRPSLPDAQALDLPGRGRTWVYDTGGDREPLLLLHGWTSTAALNWFRCMPSLAGEHRVIALDQRGHGQGIKSRAPFRLEDCSDDAAVLVEHLGLGRATVAGYSMGGPVAQLMWRRHPDSVGALVLCATAARFAGRREFAGALGALTLGASMALALLPSNVRRQGMSFATRNWMANAGAAPWAVEEWGRNDPSSLMQAGVALGKFDSTSWVGEIDVPAAVVVTTEDNVVSPRRQWYLARSIPGARAFPVEGDHRACVEQADRFVPALVAACRAVRGTVEADVRT